jgi:hypothetical protein
MVVAGVVGLFALTSAPLAVTLLADNGVALPGVGSAQRLMAMIDARSPGEREKGELAQTKVKQRLAAARERGAARTSAANPTPVEQLAKVVVGATPPPIPQVEPVVPLAVADIISPVGLIASAPLASGAVVIGGSVLGAPGGGAGGGGGAPGSGVTPTGGDVPPVTSVTSPVPEPGTWLTMLLGFGIIGSAMARRRERMVRAAA